MDIHTSNSIRKQLSEHKYYRKSENELRVNAPFESTKPCTILLAEDDIDDQKFALETFKKTKLVKSVHTLPDGTDLINYMKQEGFYDHSIISYTPIIIVLDLEMPKMNGFEVLQDIRSDCFLCEIPIIVLSSIRNKEKISKAFQYGATGYLMKPIKPHQIEHFIENAWQWPPKELW